MGMNDSCWPLWKVVLTELGRTSWIWRTELSEYSVLQMTPPTWGGVHSRFTIVSRLAKACFLQTCKKGSIPVQVLTLELFGTVLIGKVTPPLKLNWVEEGETLFVLPPNTKQNKKPPLVLKGSFFNSRSRLLFKWTLNKWTVWYSSDLSFLIYTPINFLTHC